MFNPDKMIAALERVRVSQIWSDEEQEALMYAIRLLNLQPSSIAYARKRIDWLVTRIKHCEEAMEGDYVNGRPAKRTAVLDKASLSRWLVELAKRQKALMENTNEGTEQEGSEGTGEASGAVG